MVDVITSVWTQMIPTTVNVILATHSSLMAIRVDVVEISLKEQAASIRQVGLHRTHWKIFIVNGQLLGMSIHQC